MAAEKTSRRARSPKPVSSSSATNTSASYSESGEFKKAPSSQEVSVVNMTNSGEDSLVLATEDVPLDNRFGKSKLSSTHEFSYSAVNTVRIDKSKMVEGKLGASVWSIVEASAQGQLANTLGVEIGSQITRKVNITFEAGPGEFAHYRVVWKQNIRRGMLEVDVRRQTLQLPYSVSYGLYHSIESIATKYP